MRWFAISDKFVGVYLTVMSKYVYGEIECECPRYLDIGQICQSQPIFDHSKY